MLYIEPDDGRSPLSHGDSLLKKTGYYYDLFRRGTRFAEYEGQ